MKERPPKLESQIVMQQWERELFVGRLYMALEERILDQMLEPTQDNQEVNLSWVTNDERFLYVAVPMGAPRSAYLDMIMDWSLMRYSRPYPDGSMEFKRFLFSVNEEDKIYIQVTNHEVSIDEDKDPELFLAIINPDINMQYDLGMTEPSFEDINDLVDASLDLTWITQERAEIRDMKADAGYFDNLPDTKF